MFDLICLMILSFFFFFESVSLSLLFLSSLVFLIGLKYSVFLGIGDLAVYIMLLSIIGGLFVLIGIVIISYPKDYDLVLSPLFKKACFSVLLLSFFFYSQSDSGYEVICCDISYIYSKSYSISFIVCLSLLLKMLFLVDFFFGGGLQGGFFSIY